MERFSPGVQTGLIGLMAFVLTCMPSAPARAEAVPSAGLPAASPARPKGYEVTVGVTSRVQSLIVFDGRGDQRLAFMTGPFTPSPQIFLTTPFHPLGQEGEPGKENGRWGYYWKYSYNRFSLDRQEDPDTGGIGSTSPSYDYGTRVQGDFLAVAPVLAYEKRSRDEAPAFRMEFGLGGGYLSLDGDAVLGDFQGQPDAPRTAIDYDGPALFLFTMGRHYWGAFMFGYQLGIMTTSSTPYSFSQSYLSLDIGYRLLF